MDALAGVYELADFAALARSNVHRHLTHLVSMLATLATADRLLLWQRPRAIPAEAAPAA